VFTPGTCAQTMLSHAGVTMMAIEDNRFTIICRTSFAPYVHDWLVDAGMEYGVSFRG
jgi:sarcosine oxidase subunit gamma